MLARVTLLAVSVLLVSGCKLELPILGGSNISGPLQVENVVFERAGGPQCPGAAETTPENVRCANLRLTYPKVLTAGSPQAAAAINQFIQEQVLEYSDPQGKAPTTPDEFSSMFVNDYNEVPDAMGVWEMERKVEVSFASDHLLTLNFSESGYTGGAHPFSGQRYFVLDLDSGKHLALNALLAPNYEAELNKVGERAFRKERNLPEAASLEEAGFWFANNSFKVNTNFGVLKDSLVFNFNAYEVAPYAMGPTEFTVSYDDIKAFIPEAGLLAAVAR
ncbi:MAG: DUF3298 and DUF4163 domain-containing protein [Thiothrix litoralis]|jgi:hypothetical protein